jgi:N-acetylglucosaminyldiphosphoundecaprenol N-acetyl-beta-D-mannosaminyltransferase
VRVAGVDIAALTLDEAVDAVLDLGRVDAPSLVVTPNVDHLVLLERDLEFRAAYDAASLRFADGRPIVALARATGTPLPQRVTGIDLTLALLAACEREGRSVYFFGGTPEHLERAVARIRSDHPDLDIVGASAPIVDVDAPAEEELAALEECREREPDLLFAFLGAPKQERWFLRRRAQLPPTIVLAVGGSVDFLAGALRRAPQWVQDIGCEWLWRLALQPRRLFVRYVVRDSRFLVIGGRACAHHVRTRWAARRAR